MTGIQARTRPPRQGPPIGFVPTVWSAVWVSLFAFGDWQIALPMVILTAPVAALGWRWRRAAKRRRRDWVSSAELVPAALAVPGAERAATSALIRVESSTARFDPDAVALVRELVDLLGPLLAQVRARGADAAVRHDLEAIAAEHLPAVIDAYLALPPAALHVAGPGGVTPADRLREQLLLLVEGCRELGDAVHHADLARQAELGRFLDAKFRRSDLSA